MSAYGPVRHVPAVIVAAVFVVLVAGASIPNPLLPLYGQTLGLAPTELAVVFSAYLGVLVPMLLIMSHPRTQSRPRTALIAALALAVCADGLFMVGDAGLLLVGRALNAVSVALGTGAAALLALLLVGERGRTIVATGTVAGSFLGTTMATILAEFAPAPALLSYVVHAVVAVLVLVAVVLRISAPRVDPVVATDVGARPPQATRRSPVRVLGYVMGMTSWAGGAVVLGLTPILTRGAFGNDSLLVASSGAMAMLGVATVTQMVLGRWPVRTAATVSLVAFTCGLVFLGLAVAAGALPLLLIAAAVLGFGQGPLYRAGMSIATAGLGPRMQGARASLYATFAYGTAAVYIVLCGLVSEAFGAGTALMGAALFLVLPAIVALPLIRQAVR